MKYLTEVEYSAVKAMRDNGMSQRKIAEQLQGAGYFLPSGSLVQQSNISAFLRSKGKYLYNHHIPEQKEKSKVGPEKSKSNKDDVLTRTLIRQIRALDARRKVKLLVQLAE